MAPLSDNVVQLPPGQPGRIAGPEIAAEPAAAAAAPGAAARRTAAAPEGGVSDEAELRRLALEEAEKVLPNEIRMMLSTSEQTVLEVMEMCQDAPGEQLEEQLANSLVDLIWAPLAGCVPQLPGLVEVDVRMKAALFWRCAVALCAMPLAQLAAMTRRKRTFLGDLDLHMPLPSATPAQERLAHVRLNLPIFAMVAKMPSELDKAAKERPKADAPAQASAAAATTSTEDGVLLEELPREPPAPRAAPADAGADRAKTAARHTYDVGYKKWEKFDVDEALREADGAPSGAPRQRVRLPGEAGAAAAPLRTSDDPVEMLEGAMQELEGREAGAPGAAAAREAAGAEEAPAAAAAGGEPPAAAAAAAPPSGAPGAASAGAAAAAAGGAAASRPRTLDEHYRRWDRFDADAEEERVADAVAAGSAAPASGALAAALGEATASAERASAAALGPAVQEGGEPRPLGEPSADAAAEAAAAGAAPASGPEESVGAAAGAAPALGAAAAEAAAADATPAPGPEEPAEAAASAAPAAGAGVSRPDDGSTTGPVLAADYRKWDAFNDEDDMNSVDDDDGGYREPALGDLDELVGPADEVALIHENWRKEHRRRQRADRPREPVPAPRRAAEPPSLPTGPVVQRPCEYRPPDDQVAAPAQAIAREYDKWRKFDVDAECLNLDNEGTTAEGDRTRVSSGPQSAVLQTENYTKDREEYDLDQDIDTQMGGLKKVIAQRVKDAVARKDEGNRLIRAGRNKEACAAYARGLEEMHLCEQASVLMSDSVQDKNKRLVSDLQRNLAAAQLEAGEFEGALEICTSLLKSSGGNDEKALYRRAMALLQLGRASDAEEDIASLAAKRGDADAAVCRLRRQSAAVN